uniref:UBR-type domain-containing protein n=1 Tax=Globodera rostochiensis TaxID=31243 RepID=A0A914GSH3_GLORO
MHFFPLNLERIPKLSIISSVMGDQKQLFLFGQALPGNECGLLERMRECAEKRNKSNQQVTPALQSIPADRIKQIAVGSTHIAFLLTDHTIARLSFEIVTNVVESLVPSDKRDDTEPYVATPGAGSAARSASSSTDPASVAAQAAVNAANRTAKIRRIMMTRPGVRSGGFCRTGVIIDRNRSNRPMIPASSVPEELIVQCQVVLQGKSRDVIVRELQRTNLNVNEAVNNLLSRDDDEIEDLDETGEAYLHEELLSLLDAGLRSDGGDGYEYVISRDLARRREDPKGKDAGKNNEGTGQTLQEHFVFGDTLEIWGKKVGTNFPMPPGVEQFKKIASMNAELLALADDGQLYGWTWEKSSAPSIAPHTANLQLFGKTTNEDNKIVDIETCALRAVVLTQSGQVGSFMDASCGRKLADAFLEHLTDVPEAVERMFCCTLFSAVLSKSGTLYWRGVYPFTERRKLWEKARSKKKQVTSSSNDIVVGSEVRTKSTPIYSVGSVAVNFTNGLPMIGTLYEDAWTLNETCRFRVQTPENYDALPIGNNEKEKHREKRVSFSLAVGNRKRAAPTASDQMDEGNNGGGEGVGGGAVVAQQQSSKESAWAIRDVVFIHEESVNDVSIVKIVDGAYCGVVFKSTLDRLEQDGGGGAAPFDLSKLSIRLMRKDDLVPITSASIRLPSSVKRIISLAVDGTGFRILCVKNHQRIHLIRVSCLGKLLSDHPMPFAQNALCQPTEGVVEPYLPSVNNYGDDNLLLIRDSTGAFQPLLRNAVGGFQELAYTSLGRFYLFGMGIRFLKSPADVNLPSICTEPFSVISNKNAKGQAVSKNVNRMMLIVALIAPTPHTTTPTTESLMQSVLNCDLNSVRNILQKLSSDSVDLDERRNVAHERIEGNRNIFHVAVMNAFAKTNRDQADVESAGGDTADTSSALSRVSKWAEKWGDSSEADSARMRKWQEMLGSSGNSAPTTRAKAHQLQAAAAAATKDGPRSSNGGAGDADEKDLWDVAISKADDEKTMATFSPSGSPSKKTIPATPKERQANGIDIVRELCKSAALHEHFVELMQQRDVNGQTPFQCAINFRAYTAAHLLWETTTDLRDWSQDVVDIVAPTCAENSDESALFALCANDTCSYTWTGEEHTPQDIFECYSCGLVDTLCCCTECAYTCHRNHDCKVKRTSPTAYCDCWEKFGCRALITGNLVKREQLLNLFLQNGKLVSKLNARGEHLLLFLVRTVGRQMFEHESYTKRTKRPVPPNNAVNAAGQRIPEHDLDPPKFARRALEIALSNWEVVKSLLEVGTKKAPIEEMQISESAFHLGEQHGSTHLDKFVFTLLAFCDESSLDTLLNLLIRQANRKNVKEPGADVHTFISRFVRSVVRLFVLVILISPNAVRTLLATVSENIVKAFVPIEPAHSDTFGLSGSAQQQQFVLSSSVPSASAAGGTSSSIRESLQNYRAVAISGVLSLVRASLPGLSGLSGAADKRDTKKKNAISFVLKCRRVFQTLLSYSLNELIGIADTLVAPLRHGIVKPTSAMIANEDAIELIHKHLNTEQDLSSLLKEVVEGGGNLANMMMTNGGNNRIKKLVEMRHNETTRPAGTTGGANDGSTEQPTHSDDEISNEEDEDDDEMENAPNQSYHRARENSSASVDRLHRERTASGGGRRGVERQTSSQAAAAAAEPQQEEGNEEEQEMNEVAAEDEHDEEDEDASEHEMEEDEEDEPYFDVHDDDDDDDDEEDDDDDASSNPSDAEAGDSNDTVPVMQPSTTSAEGGGAEGDVRIELVQPDAATTSANNAVDALDRFSAALAAVDGTGGGRAASGTEAASAPRRPAEATPTSGINNEGFGVTSATGRNAGLQQQIDQMATIDGVFREPTLEGSSSSTNRLWRVGGTPLETAGGAGTTAAAVNAPGPNSEAYIAEDYQYLQSNTSTQLALCYSILVKLADELLVQLMCHTKWKQQLCRVKGISSFLDIDSVLYPEFKHLLTESFEPTWNWLHIIMDRTEAQLKYSQAISQSIVGPMVSPLASAEREEQRAAAQLAAVGTGTTADTTQQQPGQPRLASRHIAAGVTTVGAVAAAAAVTGDTTTQRRFRKKGNAGGGGLGRKPDGSAANGGAENEAENSTARTEFFTYFMSLLRSYSAESGDDLPVLEYNALRNVAFVAEAYFFHLIFLGQLKQLELENGIGVVDVQNGVGGDDIDDNEALMEVDGTNKIINEGHARRLRRFYRRSNSISYPTLSTAEQHHAFTFTAAEALPLAIRSHLLSADAERNALFALPVPERSRVGHKAIATKLGVQFPTHQSLSRLPVQYSEIVHRLSCHQQRDELGQEKQRSTMMSSN